MLSYLAYQCVGDPPAGLDTLLVVARLSQIGELWQDQYIGELLAPLSGRRATPREFDVAYIAGLIDGDSGVEAHFRGYFKSLLEIRLRSIVEG